MLSDSPFSLSNQHSLDALIAIDGRGCICELNHLAESLLGWGSSEVIGRSVHDVLCSHSAYNDHDEASCSLRNNNQHNVEPNEVYWVHKNQENIAVSYRQTPILLSTTSSESEAAGLIVFQTSENLGYQLEELKKLSAFTDINPAPLLELDSQALILFSNPCMTELMLEYGFDDEGSPSVLPKNLPDLVQRCLSIDVPLENIEAKAVDPENEMPPKHFLWSCHPVRHNNTGSVLLCGLDVSNKKELELQQEKFKQTLEEEKVKARKEYLVKMVHELRTPLNAVVGYAMLLKVKLSGKITEAQSSLFDRIIEGGLVLADQISSTLQAARVESGSIDADFKYFTINPVIQDIVLKLSSMADDKGLSVITDIPDEPIHICADLAHVKQILINLFSNAVKYTSTGSINVSLASIEDVKLGECIAMSVKDTGSGISDTEKDAVFELFSRQDLHISSEIEGEGLGLAICSEMVDLHHGRIDLQTELGKGSTFTVLLPLQQALNN